MRTAITRKPKRHCNLPPEVVDGRQPMRTARGEAMTVLAEITQLEQEMARDCAKCINTFSGVPMLVAKGATLQCRLRTCNRKRHKAKMAELKRLERLTHV